MALRGVVSSKFRHTFGTAAKRELCYEGVKISRNAHDGNFCAVSTRHLAIVTDSSGGGTFVVVPLNQVSVYPTPFLVPCLKVKAVLVK
jgi:hypothetical protein